MRYLKYFVAIFIVIFSINTVWAQSFSTQMTPTISERLNNPIKLSGICSDVKIIEWRGTRPNKSNIRKIKKYCKIAMYAFPRFVAERGYSLYSGNKLQTNICMIPADSSPRNLNDVNYRFSSRTKSYDEYGNVEKIWGYYQRHANYIYVRSDVVTDYKVVFVHELFHAASYNFGIYEQHKGNKNIKDEQMAQEFTIYLGLGR